MSWGDLAKTNGDKPARKKTGKSGKRPPTAKQKRVSNEFADLEVTISDDETLENSFELPTLKRKRSKGEKITGYGQTGGGKTRFGILMGRLNKEHVVEDIDALKFSSAVRNKAVDRFMEAFDNQEIFQGNPIICLGTEESTEDAIYGEDQWELVADLVGKKQIMYKEVFVEYDSGPNQSFIDPFESYRNFVKYFSIVKRSNPLVGTVMVDSGTSKLGWEHNIIRRKVMKIPELQKEQGVPTRYWFWRNEKEEAFQLALRSLKCNTYVTWKEAKDKEGNYIDRPKWHDDTSGHLTNHVLRFPIDDEQDRFKALVVKCRRTRRLRMKTIFYPTPLKFFGLMIGAFTFKDLKGKE